MITLLISTSGWHHDGWFWLWPLVPLAWLLVVLLVVRLFWRRGSRTGPWGPRAAPDPRTIVAERYARGEIDHDEYRERLRHLEEGA